MGAPGVPTPGAFLGGQMPGQMPQMPGLSGQMPGMMGSPIAFQKPRRSVLGMLVTLIIVLGTLGGIGAAIWGVMKANDAVNSATDAVDHANDVSDKKLNQVDLTALGLTGGEQFLWSGAAPAAMAAAFDNGIDGQPTNFLEISYYADYSFATAQSTSQPDHFDQYSWRTGVLGSGSPQPNDAEAANKTFTIDQMNWSAIAAVAADAVNVSKVEQGTISHIIIQRDDFTDGSPLIARIYVSGPRSSAYIEVGADGTVLAVR